MKKIQLIKKLFKENTLKTTLQITRIQKKRKIFYINVLK